MEWNNNLYTHIYEYIWNEIGGLGFGGQSGGQSVCPFLYKIFDIKEKGPLSKENDGCIVYHGATKK